MFCSKLLYEISKLHFWILKYQYLERSFFRTIKILIITETTFDNLLVIAARNLSRLKLELVEKFHPLVSGLINLANIS